MTPAHLIMGSVLLVDLTCAVIVFATNTRRTANQHFLSLSLAVAAWVLCVLMALSAVTDAQAAFWIRQAAISAALLAVALNLLRLAIKYPECSWWAIVVRASWTILALVPIGLLCQTAFFMKGARLPAAADRMGTTVAEPVYGLGFVLYLLCFFGFFGYLLRGFIRDLRQARGIGKVEIQFVLLGCCSALLLGGVLALVIPVLTGTYQTAPFAPSSVVLMNGIIAYGIATRRIMGVAAVIQRVMGYGLLTAYLCALYFTVHAGTRLLLNPFLRDPGEWPRLLAALAVAFSVAPAHGRIQNFTARLIRREVPDLRRITQQAGKALQAVTTLDDLLEHFGEIVRASMGTDRVVVLLPAKDAFRQAYPTPDGATPLQLDDVSSLATSLSQTDEPFVWDAVQRLRGTPLLKEAADDLRKLEAALAIGIHSKGKLSGIMLLGPRTSGHIYGLEEQEALQVLSNQLAVAVDNATLYTEAQDSRIYNDILLNSLVSGIVAADRNQTLTVCNPEAQRITGLGDASVLGQSIDILPAPLARMMRDTLATGQRQQDQDLAIELPPEGNLFVRAGSSVFHSHTGETLGVLLVIHDVTALKTLQEQIRRSDRLASMGTLSAGMAHEIKNPLVTIKTFAQLLPERYEDSDFRQHFTALVGDEVKRIDRLVNQLLAFARPSKPQMADIHLHQVLDASLRLVEQEFHRRQIRIERRYESRSDLIHGDADLLSQAFVNFFLNAHESMGEGGRLRVATAVANHAYQPSRRKRKSKSNLAGFIRVDIEDTGCGIKEADIVRIFDPFFTTKSEGTGLGLAVSHGIIDEHGGLIDVQSILGRGTTLSVVLPLTEKEAPA